MRWEKLKKLWRQIFDSRGNPTEAKVFTVKVDLEEQQFLQELRQDEAVELRDNNKKFSGKGVMSAVNNVNKTIAKNIIGKNIQNQEELIPYD